MPSHKLTDFDFALPPELIAKHPVYPRENCRLLYWRYSPAVNLHPKQDHSLTSTDIRAQQAGGNSAYQGGSQPIPYTLTDSKFTELLDYCQAGDLLVLNNSSVLPAYLHGYVQSQAANNSATSSTNRDNKGILTDKGRKISINLLKKIDYATKHIMGGDMWQVLAKPSRLLTQGAIVVFADDFWARVERQDEAVHLIFNCSDEVFLRKLEEHGHMPLPPYLKREATAQDKHDYQNVFAAHPGSVAAPTAGLHFSAELLHKLRAKGVKIAFITLHVGGGTFLPIKHDNLDEHKMHAEFFTINSETCLEIALTRRENKRVIAVGTTVMRVLESVAKGEYSNLDGTRGLVPNCLRSLHTQATTTASETSCNHSDNQVEIDGNAPQKAATSGYTYIFIQPGFKFALTDVLITNFHLPKSTLFVLVSAFASLSAAHYAYHHAIANGYRFFSYGDACLIEKNHDTARK